jgi:ADP-ribose pyrophosphatase YjhB (NUDIX family)
MVAEVVSIQFVPKREIWFVAAFVNSSSVDPYAKADEIGRYLEEGLRAMTSADLPRLAHDPATQARAVELARSVKMRSSWHSYVDGFPFIDENTGLLFNKLGYFQFDVEYFPDAPERRAELDPIVVQQPPTVALSMLQRLAKLKANSALLIDTGSPIFLFVVTDEARPEAPPWSTANVRLHKRALGAWAEVYSGSWPDYTEELYDRRVENNLSNRLSEIHLIRKNSGFIYMAPENMRMFFDGYMRTFVVAPTAQLRAMHFALMSINASVDILLMRQAREDFLDVAVIEEKLKSLRQLRSSLHMKMSEIYNELDSNKRQHYSSVLAHVLRELNLSKDGLFARIDAKFESLNEGMSNLYQRQEALNQEQTEARLKMLNTLFSLMALADFSALLVGTVESAMAGDLFPLAVNGTFTLILLVVLILAITGQVRYYLARAIDKPTLAADALVVDDKGRVLVITRRDPPFRGQRAFPGTLVQGGGSAESALVREVKDQTNLDIVVERLLGTYDSETRDPRGRIKSQAYVCRLQGDAAQLRCREDASAVAFVALADLDGEEMAFDHEDMASDARRLLAAEA